MYIYYNIVGLFINNIVLKESLFIYSLYCNYGTVFFPLDFRQSLL